MPLFIIAIYLSSSLLLAECNQLNTSRFTINKGEVFDNKTKLTWLRCSVGSIWKEKIGCIDTPKIMYFDEAIDFIQNLNNEWRMPTIIELDSITEKDCKKLAINSAIFPDIKKETEYAPYWSITHVENMPMLFYYIDFINNKVDAHSKGFSMFVRLVSDKKKNE